MELNYFTKISNVHNQKLFDEINRYSACLSTHDLVSSGPCMMYVKYRDINSFPGIVDKPSNIRKISMENQDPRADKTAPGNVAFPSGTVGGNDNSPSTGKSYLKFM